MTDEELIKRLHNLYTKSGVEGYYTKANTVTFAADRIEALIAERDALFRRAALAEEWRDHDKSRAEAAEAKLSKTEGLLAENEVRLRKAVEALEYADRMVRLDLIHMTDFDCDDFSQAVVDTGERIKAALARVKGETK